MPVKMAPNISQGSVATGCKCRGITGENFITSSLLSLTVKAFQQLVTIWRRLEYSGTRSASQWQWLIFKPPCVHIVHMLKI